MFTFPNDSVIILRKRRNSYVQESITTDTMLPSTGISPEENRKSVIARLRHDPMVFFVLEPVNGIVDEEALHPSGFSFHLTVHEGKTPSAELKVNYKDSLAYEQHYPDGQEDEAGEEEEFSLEDVLEDVLSTVRMLLHAIAENDYGFVLESCPYFVRRERGEDIDLFTANRLLCEAGFQTERLSVANYLSEPILIIHENDAVLVGSHNFDGENLFVEMKRFFIGASEKNVEEAIKKVQGTNFDIAVIRWEDESWSFRTYMDEDTDSLNFIEKLNGDIACIREFIQQVEDEENVGKEPWDTMTQQRHYFISETLDQSFQLKKLKV